MKRIALVNQKGGCGKTTTAINLASCLAQWGKRVLIVDLDPQGHVALGMGRRGEDLENTLYEVLLEKIPLSQAIVNLTENLDGLLSNVVLSAFEQCMAGVPDREKRLSRCLESVTDQYDYLLIDSPPSVGLLTFNGLLAAEQVIVPVDPSYFSLHGLGKLLETLQIVENRTHHTLAVRILPTNMDQRTNFCRQVLHMLHEHFPEKCLHTVIRACTKIREAGCLGQSIFAYDPACNACHDYKQLAREILNREAAHGAISGERLSDETAKKTVVFTLQAPLDADVKIAGDFNQWTPESLDFHDFNGSSAWHKLIRLDPGSYEYKYLIDGRWVPDPENGTTVVNRMGSENSVLKV